MKYLLRLIALILAASIMLSVVSCVNDKNNTDNPSDNISDGAEDNNDNSDNNENTGDNGGNGDNGDNGDNGGNGGNNSDGSGDNVFVAEHTVTVTNPFGLPLSGVTVFLYDDSGESSIVCSAPVNTDGQGSVKFEIELSKAYSVGIMGYQNAYSAKTGNTREERYQLSGESTKIVLGANPTYSPTEYKLGDVMANFTLTDIYGNEYELYDLLGEKKAIMLNFWFTTCPPCKAEFPPLNTSYNKYKNDIEILAVNDTVNTVAMIKAFDDSFALDMPLCKTEYGSAVSLSRFDSQGYPTTVIIDRYGIVSFVHVGAVTSVSYWDALFDFYTKDDYVQTLLNDFNEIL